MITSRSVLGDIAVTCIVALCLVLLPRLCHSQSHPPSGSENHENDASHSGHVHHIGVFGGVTVNLEQSGSSPTIGVDYSWKFHSGDPSLEVGLFSEAILASHTEWLLGALFYVKPFEVAWFRVGLGVEFLTEESEHSGEPLVHRSEFVFRLGAGFPFTVGAFVFAPSIDLDVVRQHTALVVGLNVGYPF